MQWPADQVERRPLAALIPSARNARTHSDAQIAQIAASIREWGWTMPILVDEAGMIIAGHGRVLAAARLDLDAVPVMVARGWSDAQKRAYLIADNKLGLNAGWNEELLRIEMADLMTMGFELPLMGFSERELSTLNASGNPGLTDRDRTHRRYRSRARATSGRSAGIGCCAAMRRPQLTSPCAWARCARRPIFRAW